VERIGRSGVGFGGVDPRVLFIPSCPGTTGLTGAFDRSDQCEPSVGFVLGDLLDSCVFGSCWCWSVLVWFGGVLLGFVKGSSSLRLFGTFVCAAAVATGLTGSATGLTGVAQSASRASFSCVLVSFGSEGCLLVPRISCTLVATWS
jgi:hypothetical protein